MAKKGVAPLRELLYIVDVSTVLSIGLGSDSVQSYSQCCTGGINRGSFDVFIKSFVLFTSDCIVFYFTLT